MMRSWGNIYIEEPLENLDSFTSKRLQAFLAGLNEKKSKNFKISVRGSLPILESENMVENRERDTVYVEAGSFCLILNQRE